MRKMLTALRASIFILTCPAEYRQGLATLFAAYMHHDGLHDMGNMAESAAAIFDSHRPKRLGRKHIFVTVTCECGQTGMSRSGPLPQEAPPLEPLESPEHN